MSSVKAVNTIALHYFIRYFYVIPYMIAYYHLANYHLAYYHPDFNHLNIYTDYMLDMYKKFYQFTMHDMYETLNLSTSEIRNAISLL